MRSKHNATHGHHRTMIRPRRASKLELPPYRTLSVSPTSKRRFNPPGHSPPLHNLHTHTPPSTVQTRAPLNSPRAIHFLPKRKSLIIKDNPPAPNNTFPSVQDLNTLQKYETADDTIKKYSNNTTDTKIY